LRPLDSMIPLFIVRLINEFCQRERTFIPPPFEYEKQTLKFPKKIDIDHQQIKQPSVNSGLIIGIGAGGKQDSVEKTLVHAKATFAERFTEKNQVNFLSINSDKVYASHNFKLDNYQIADEEREILDVDLRPYLQEYRDKEDTALRCWIPVKKWLAEPQPLTSHTDDRRKARLALLLDPESLEKKLQKQLEKLNKDVAKVVIVIHVDDIQATGLMTEVAHILASTKNRSFSITLVIMRPYDTYHNNRNLTGMIRELSRMLHCGGEAIYSDRGGKIKQAFNLKEKIFIVDIHPEYPKTSSINLLENATAHFLWTYFTVPNEKFLQETNNVNQFNQSYAIHLYDSYILPQKSIWQAIRLEILYLLINKKWGKYKQENIELTEKINLYRENFWLKRLTINYPHPINIQKEFGAKLLQGGHSDIQFVGKSIQLLFPSNKSIHARANIRSLLKEMLYYLSSWIHDVLQQEKPIFGLYVLTKTLYLLKKDMKKIIDYIERYKDQVDRVDETINFMVKLINQLINIIDTLIHEIEDWLTVFIGWYPEMSKINNDKSQQSIYEKIEILMQQRKSSTLLKPYQEKITQLAKDWYDDKAKNILKEQIQFDINTKIKRKIFILSLNIFKDKRFELKQPQLGEMIFDHLESQLDNYKHEILKKLNPDWINLTRKNKEISLSDTTIKMVGKLSENLYSRSNDILNVNDEVFLDVFSYEQNNLSHLMQISDYSEGIYTWSEEFNAEKLSNKVRNKLRLNTTFQSDYDIVTYLKDPQLLYAIILALVTKVIYIEGQQIYLKHISEKYFINQYDNNEIKGNNFYKILDRLIIFGKKGNIPNIREDISSDLSREELLSKFFENPLINSFDDDQLSAKWGGVISALDLEYKNQKTRILK